MLFINKFFKTLVALFLIISAILLLLFVLVEYVINPCDSTILKNESLNQDEKVVLFLKGCGATTSNVYHLSVIKEDESITDRSMGNMVIYDGESLSFSIKEEKIYIKYGKNGEFYKKNTLKGIIIYDNKKAY